MQNASAHSSASNILLFSVALLFSSGAVGESHSSLDGPTDLVPDAKVIPDEMVVSVRKQSESLQEVPISVSVINEAVIDRLGVYNLQDVTELTPSLILDEGFAPQDTRVVIRGLSPTRGRQNVAFLQDGIDISSEALTTAGGSLLTNPRLFDLERVEVVKGPQSALFGRSAFNGGINYVTKRPGDEFEGTARLDVNDQVFGQLSGSISGPVIADKLNMGLAAAGWDAEGYYRNSVTGEYIGGSDGVGVSATALITPTETVEFFARLEYSDDHYDPTAQATAQPTETLPIPAAAYDAADPADRVLSPALTDVLVPQGRVPDSDDLSVRLSENPRTGVDYPGTDREIIRFSLIGDFDLGVGDLTYFGHLANVQTTQFQDAFRAGSIFDEQTFPPDLVITNSAESNLDQETDLTSHELRFSRQDGPVDWAVGALYWREKAELSDASNSCFQFAFPPTPDSCGTLIGQAGSTIALIPRDWERDTEHWSVYVDLDWQLADQWVLGFEVRYAQEELDVTGPDSQIIFDEGAALGGSTNDQPANDVSGSVRDDYWAPKLTLQWLPKDDLMFYASAAKGVKPAGISTVVGGVAPFDPDLFAFEQEVVWVYEVGGKSTLADGALILNGAVFFQDFTDKQVSTQVNISPGVVGIVPDNAGKAEIWGFEIDSTWFITDRLSLTGGYTWLHGEYTEFNTESSGGSSIARAGNCVVTVNASGDNVCQLDLSGRELEGLPEHSLVAILGYRFPVSSQISVLAEVQGQYQSERYQSEFNVLEFQDYWLADLRLGLQSESWEVLAYVDNVFDDSTVKSGFVSPDFSQFNIIFNPPPVTVGLPNQATYSLATPRTIGLRSTFRF